MSLARQVVEDLRAHFDRATEGMQQASRAMADLAVALSPLVALVSPTPQLGDKVEIFDQGRWLLVDVTRVLEDGFVWSRRVDGGIGGGFMAWQSWRRPSVVSREGGR